MRGNEDGAILLVGLALVVGLLMLRKGWRPSSTAFGTARFATEDMLGRAGMLAGNGLILGRTLSGTLLWVPQYVHTLLIGGSGAGKGVSIIIPILLSYFRGSVVVFDLKGDLYSTTAHRRRGKIIHLAPFNGGEDCFNPLDTILPNSPMLVDSARAMAEALVVRQGSEPDPHWNDKAVTVITAILVLVLMRFDGAERSLNSVGEIASAPALVHAAADKLIKIGGIPGRLGNQLKALFGSDGEVTKEGAGVMSTVTRHLSFLDSALVAKSLATSTFKVDLLRKNGTTIYFGVSADQLESQKGYLRCVTSTLIRELGRTGSEKKEVLFLLDEAGVLGGLPAIEEALVRGRSAGVRLLLAYQSNAQVESAFKDKKTLLYDNCTVQIYLGANSYETADRISKSLGEYTQTLESYGVNSGRSWQQTANSGQPGSENVSSGSNFNYSVNARALLKPEEVLQLDPGLLIAFVRGVAPILGRRILWYSDPHFCGRRLRMPTMSSLLWWALMAGAIGLVMWGLAKGGLQWQLVTDTWPQWGDWVCRNCGMR